MTTTKQANELPPRVQRDAANKAEKVEDTKPSRWKKLLGGSKATKTSPLSRASSDGLEDVKSRPERWSLGVLNDRETDEVPGMWFQHHVLGAPPRPSGA